MIEEKGPWAAAFGNDKTFIESDDFTHDVRLYVSGDFKSTEQIVEYAEEIAKRLNTYASRDVEVAELKKELYAISVAIDDPRTDLTMTMVEVIADQHKERDQLREQVTMLRDALDDKQWKKDGDVHAHNKRVQEALAATDPK